MPSLAKLIDDLAIPHAAFKEAQRRLELAFNYADGKAEAEGIAVIGESGTGKTCVLSTFVGEHPTKRERDGLRVPVLIASLPSDPTVKSLAEKLLRELGDPDSAKGTEIQKTLRLRRLLLRTGTKVIAIDEFQQFVERGGKIIPKVSDWLKRLIDDARATLVIAGLPSALAVIEQNPQLARRFSAPIILKRFDWTDKEMRKDFRSVLKQFEIEIGKHIQVLKLSETDIAFRFYSATGGYMGLLTKLLRHALRDADNGGKAGISMEDLDRAHRESVWRLQSGLELPRPFALGFQAVPTQDLLAAVAKIGEPVEPVIESRRGRSNGRRKPSLTEVFSK